MGRITAKQQFDNEALLIATLLYDGPFKSDRGRARGELLRATQKRGGYWKTGAALDTYLSRFAADGVVVIERGNDGATSVELVEVPDRFVDAVNARESVKECRALATGATPKPAEASPSTTTPERAPVGQPVTPESVGPTADEVANAILNKVFEIHSRPARAEENTQRLREALDQREAAVRRAKDLAEDLQVAVRSVQSGREKITRLEGELAQVRENLRQAMAATKFAVDEQVQKEVAKLMKPSNGKVSV